MADETTTSTSSEATAADFSAEELATSAGQTAEAEKPDGLDEEFDFDPAQEEFEIPTPKEEKENEERAGPIAEKVESPKEKKEEKKPGGAEEPKTSQDTKKSPGQIPSDNAADESVKKEAGTPIPPETSSKSVKVKIGDKDYECPEDTYQAIKDTVETAKNIRAHGEELARGLIEKTTDTLEDLFTRYFKGDKAKAHDHLVQECAAFIDKELQRQAMPKEQRDLLEAQEKLQALEEENKRFREQEENRKRETERREALDGFMGEVVQTMKELGMDTKPENEDSKQFAFKAVDELMALRESGKPALPIEVVKQFKAAVDRQQLESAKKYEKSLDDIPDEDLIRDHPKLVERLRKADIAKLKKGDTPAKTAPKPTNGAERETKPRSKYNVLNAAGWEKTWH